jgi:nucleoside-diphosphate-sugar epimerase
MTGSTGLIGERLADALCSEYDVVGLDVKRPQSSAALSGFVRCDLTDEQSVRSALEAVRERYGPRIAGVIHLAAYYDFSGEPSPLYEQLTVEGTRRMLRGLQDFEVEQLVFSSSLLVLQSAATGETLTEQSPLEGEWAYPASKIAAEEVLRAEHGRIPCVVLRIAGVYDESCHSIPIAQHIRRIHDKSIQSYFFPGNPEHGSPYVHLVDLVECVRLCLERRSELGPFEVFLVAEPQVVSHKELQERLGELLHGREWPTLRIPKAAAKAGAWAQEHIARQETFIKPWMVDLADQHYPAAIDRARQKLGWQPQHRLLSALDEMIARLRRDPEHWYRLNKLEPPAQALEESAGLREAGEDKDR